MTRTLQLDPADLLQDGKACPFDYYILIGEMNVGTFCVESYGVRVVDRRTGESAQVPHVTIRIPRIDELMELLIRQQVGPITLRDVVDDWLAQ